MVGEADVLIRFWNWLIEPAPEPKPCESCITLRQQLEHERYENTHLLNLIIEINTPRAPEVFTTTDEHTPLPNTRFNSFKEKRKELEAQSRIESQRLEQLKKDTVTSDKVEGIAELEDLIGVGGI